MLGFELRHISYKRDLHDVNVTIVLFSKRLGTPPGIHYSRLYLEKKKLFLVMERYLDVGRKNFLLNICIHSFVTGMFLFNLDDN